MEVIFKKAGKTGAFDGMTLSGIVDSRQDSIWQVGDVKLL